MATIEQLYDELDSVLAAYNEVNRLASYKPEYGGPSTRAERDRMDAEAAQLANEARALEDQIQLLNERPHDGTHAISDAITTNETTAASPPDMEQTTENALRHFPDELS